MLKSRLSTALLELEICLHLHEHYWILGFSIVSSGWAWFCCLWVGLCCKGSWPAISTVEKVAGFGLLKRGANTLLAIGRNGAFLPLHFPKSFRAEVAPPLPEEGGRERPDRASSEFLFAGLNCFLLCRAERSSDARPATVTKVDSRRKLFVFYT